MHIETQMIILMPTLQMLYNHIPNEWIWSLTKESKRQPIKCIKSVRFQISFGIIFQKTFTKRNELAPNITLTPWLLLICNIPSYNLV